MTHLSKLGLDRAAAGFDREPTGHLAQCEACTARVAALQAEDDAVRGSEEFARGRARLAGLTPVRRHSWAWVAAPAAAVAIVLALVLPNRQTPTTPTEGPQPAERVKGDAAVWLQTDADEQPLERLSLGDTIWLGVRSPGWSQALVMAVDEDGGVTQIWPGGGTTSAELPRRGGGRLDAAFRVTPGAMALFAFFSESTVAAEGARASLRAAVEACRSGRVRLDCLDPARVPGERARAKLLYADPGAAK